MFNTSFIGFFVHLFFVSVDFDTFVVLRKKCGKFFTTIFNLFLQVMLLLLLENMISIKSVVMHFSLGAQLRENLRKIANLPYKFR